MRKPFRAGAALVAALSVQTVAAQQRDPIVVSAWQPLIYRSLGMPRPSLFAVMDEGEVPLVVSVTNAAAGSIYVARNLHRMDQYLVRNSSGRRLTWISHLPPPPPIPENANGWIRLERGASVTQLVKVPLAELGVNEADVYEARLYCHGVVAERLPAALERLDFFYTHSPPFRITVGGTVYPTLAAHVEEAGRLDLTMFQRVY